MKRFPWCWLAMQLAVPFGGLAQEQGYTFTTIAGRSAVGNVDGVGVEARFDAPIGITSDSAGNLYVVDANRNTVRKITPDAVVTTLAGTSGQWGAADGIGSSARFNNPESIFATDDGTLYVADSSNNAIRKITPDGVVRTLAGGRYGSSDGVGNGASFGNPYGIVVDQKGFVYVADTFSHTIRRIDRDGLVTTIAGKAGQSGTADGADRDARFNQPMGLAVDADGTLYIADSGNHTIRKMTAAGAVTTLAGLAGASGSADGVGSAARFFAPHGIAVDARGVFYVADSVNSMVRKLTPDGTVTTVARGFYGLRNLTVSPRSGDIFVADVGNHTIKKVTVNGTVTIFAGLSLSEQSQDGVGATALFRSPHGLKVDATGTVFVVDGGAPGIRRLSPTGVVTTWAGQLGRFDHADGLGTGAHFAGPWGLALDLGGNLYVTEFGGRTVRKIDTQGMATTIAGAYSIEGDTDGRGSAARFRGPGGIAVDAAGNLFVADMHANTLRRIDSSGMVTTPFGSPGLSAFVDGVGNAARFNTPSGLAFDSAGNLYVSDVNNHAIRKISPTGQVTTLAGSSMSSGNRDGKGAEASFQAPYDLAVDAEGNVFVADGGAHTIRRIRPDGTTTTIGGLYQSAGTADGIGDQARFNQPMGIAVDRYGNLWISESGGNLIRKGVIVGAKAAAFTVQPLATAVGAGAKATLTVAASGPPTPIYQWQRQAAGTTGFVALTDGDGYQGTATAMLTITTATAAMNGDQFRCVANNGIGALATSQAIVLTVTPPPVFTSAERATFSVGASGSFTIAAKGATLFKVTSGTLPAWATLDPTSGVLSGLPADPSGSPFTFVIEASNAALAPATQSFTLTVSPGPTFSVHPKAVTANTGSTAILTADAVGVPPIKLQWMKDGAKVSNSATVSGAATNLLAIGNAQLTDAGSYTLEATGVNGVVVSSPAMLTIVTPPAIAVQPLSQSVADGSRISFTVGATSSTPISFQWYYNGQPITGATAAIYAITAANANWVGEYTVRVFDAKTSVLSQPAILNVVTGAKLAGAGQEVGADITHPNGKVYDQTMLTGVAATLKADADQVMRISCIDLDDDIVQIEFSGAGSINIRLDAATGPAAPLNYNQSVQYMKGHATIIIEGADETTNVSVFTVGRSTAINQALFKSDVTYDGVADLASITITSRNGKFGGVFTGNASYFATKGLTGLYAPGVQFLGPVVVGNISGADAARAVFILGSASDVRVAGGDLAQMNLQPVQVDGLTKVTFTAGGTSHGVALPANPNRARLERNGVDLTDQIVVNPTP